MLYINATHPHLQNICTHYPPLFIFYFLREFKPILWFSSKTNRYSDKDQESPLHFNMEAWTWQESWPVGHNHNIPTGAFPQTHGEQQLASHPTTAKNPYTQLEAPLLKTIRDYTYPEN